MAESRAFGLNQPLDIKQILTEAQHRWLRPSEICEILRNYQKFYLTSDPPYKPPGGSLFLFDRKTLRYFRKDGHCWRKKKDGKTVREAHEKLKAGSVDVLHCYYAHGEDNENFQRRSYWMLDGQLQHIVLVHYREVREGCRSAIPRMSITECGSQNAAFICHALPHSSPMQENSPTFAVNVSNESSTSTADWNGQTPEFEDVDSEDDFDSVAEHPSSCSEIPSIPPNGLTDKVHLQYKDPGSPSYEGGELNGAHCVQTGYFRTSHKDHMHPQNLLPGVLSDANPSTSNGLSSWPDIVSSKRDIAKLYESELNDRCGVHYTEGYLKANPKLENIEHVDYFSVGCMTNDSYQIPQSQLSHSFNLLCQSEEKRYSCMNDCNNHSLDPAIENCLALNDGLGSSLGNGEQRGEVTELDSFGQWVHREIGGDTDGSLMPSVPSLCWCPLNSDSSKEASGISQHMQLDVDSLGPSLSQVQLFSITDFSPDWAYADTGTKVLVFGNFLEGLKQHPNSINWCCMFGEKEVSAEILSANVIRCQAPVHASGQVPFYVTCGDRLACSEIREFEYCVRPSWSQVESDEELCLQISFAKMLFTEAGLKCEIDCFQENCEKCMLMCGLFHACDSSEWVQVEKASEGSLREELIQKMLKVKLFEWLVCKAHEDGKGPCVLDEAGRGVIHLAAALGYDWALKPVIAAGMSPSFRDSRGRTALHWAAYYGREETVVELVRLGAAPGAVDDPTSKCPGGQTAADVASGRGHKGIAGYLAQVDLTTHLSHLTLEQNDLGTISVGLSVPQECDENVEQSDMRSDLLSLRESLAAVRNSAQAAARIQATFRIHSFKQRQVSAKSNIGKPEISSEVIALASLKSKAQKLGHFGDSLHAAAMKIQQKYRGWKGRKEFLNIRHRIVKIQAHVRGHQVRKQYKKVVWSVGIVEKAILRWRRKGMGLRGFRVGKTVGYGEAEIEKLDEYDFLREGRRQKVVGVEKALARVQSMARYPEARDQYMRLLIKSKFYEARASAKIQGVVPGMQNDFLSNMVD